MNWYKIAKRFLQTPLDIDDIVEKILSRIKKLHNYEGDNFLTQVEMYNPYLDINIPVSVNVGNSVLGNEHTKGGGFTNIHDIIKEHKGEKIIGFSPLYEPEENGYIPYEVIFSDYDTPDRTEEIDSLSSYIIINVPAHKDEDDLKTTISHELKHLIDPNTNTKMFENYKRPQDEDGFEGYLNNRIEYNARIGELADGIVSSIQRENEIEEKRELLNLYLSSLRNGNIEYIMEDIDLNWTTYEEIAMYYLQNLNIKKDIQLKLFNFLTRLMYELV